MSHFLKALVARPDVPYVLRNERTALAVATILEPAFDSRSRKHGLLGRDNLPPGVALIIAPCGGIHTLFMRFAIDVVFVRRNGEVIKVCRSVKPWRVAIAFSAFAAIELASGGAALSGTRPGDRLLLQPLP